MIKLFASVVALFALTAIGHATGPQRGYSPYVYHQHDHYHRHDHFHYGVPPGWSYRYAPRYSLEYSYPSRPRYFKKKRKVRSGASLGPNWYYCKSYWRQPVYMTDGPRFWWPYYNPRPMKPVDAKSVVGQIPIWKDGDADPCKYKNTRKKAPGFRPY